MAFILNGGLFCRVDENDFGRERRAFCTEEKGVPPTKRLFRVAMLDPSPEFIGHLGMFGDPELPFEWSRPTGLKLARENLQSRVKEEDSITDVENAVLAFGVVEFSLSFSLLIKSSHMLFTELIKFHSVELAMVTSGFQIKFVCFKQ
ncbi:hypothetical protein Tco_0073941 [Tanacetum coccineum]